MRESGLTILVDHTVLLALASHVSLPFEPAGGSANQNRIRMLVPEVCISYIKDQPDTVPKEYQGILPVTEEPQRFLEDPGIILEVIGRPAFTKRFGRASFQAYLLRLLELQEEPAVLWTYDPDTFSYAISLGAKARLLNTNSQFLVRDLFLPDTTESESIMILTEGPLSFLDITPLDERQLEQISEGIFEAYPPEAMFRTHTSLAGESDQRVFYSLSKRAIEGIIAKSPPTVRQFIEAVYSTWQEDVRQWVEESAEAILESLRTLPCQIVVSHRGPEASFLSCRIKTGGDFLLKPGSEGEQESDLPPVLPTLTQRMCSDVDRIDSLEYTSLFGLDGQFGQFLSPAYLMADDQNSQDDTSFTLKEVRPQQLTYSCPRPVQGEASVITILLSARELSSEEGLGLCVTLSGPDGVIEEKEVTLGFSVRHLDLFELTSKRISEKLSLMA